MSDPNQLFVTNATTRAGIAEDLNEYLEECDGVEDRLAIDDDRLTEEICREYAQQIGEIDEDFTDSAQAECLGEIQEEALVACGILKEGAE